MAYKLTGGVHCVSGASRSALYDTNSGNVFSINDAAKRLIEAGTGDHEFWGRLGSLGLVQPADQPEPLGPLPEAVEVELEFVWLEIISDDCNERCLHCYADSMPPTYRHLVPASSIGRHIAGGPASKPKVSANKWRQVIRDAFELGCQSIQFIGGEPFLYRGEHDETVLDLCEHAKTVGHSFIEVYTNATLLTREKVARIKDLGLHMAVSLYSDRAGVHDAITRTKGSHARTMAGLALLRHAGIDTRVEIVVMRTNQATVKSTVQLIEELGFTHGHPDPLRPKGRGDNPLLMPDARVLAEFGLQTRPNFRADYHTVQRYRSGHSCMAGRIAITDVGDVLPCIFSRNQVVGNVQASSLKELVTGPPLQQVWYTTKDDVLVCKDCEYRYVCFDCRPLSEGAAAGRGDYLHAPYPRCTYNPYTGEWGQGLWQLDECGKPWYNRSLAPPGGTRQSSLPHHAR